MSSLIWTFPDASGHFLSIIYSKNLFLLAIWWDSHVGIFFPVPAHVQNCLGIIVWSCHWLTCPGDSYSWSPGFWVSTEFSMWAFLRVLALPKVSGGVLLLPWDSPLNIGSAQWSVYWAHAYLCVFTSLELGLPCSPCEDTFCVLDLHHRQHGHSLLDIKLALISIDKQPSMYWLALTSTYGFSLEYLHWVPMCCWPLTM